MYNPEGRIVRTEYIGYATVCEVDSKDAGVIGRRESPSKLIRRLSPEESADIAWM